MKIPADRHKKKKPGFITSTYDWMNPKVTIWMKCVDRFHRVIFKVKCQWYGYFRMFLSGK